MEGVFIPGAVTQIKDNGSHYQNVIYLIDIIESCTFKRKYIAFNSYIYSINKQKTFLYQKISMNTAIYCSTSINGRHFNKIIKGIDVQIGKEDEYISVVGFDTV